jgi:hypothetical protein
MIILLSLGSTAHGQRVFKCTDDEGSITFQDHACANASDEKGSAAAKKGNTLKRNGGGQVVPLPLIGEVTIATPDYAETTVDADGERSTSVTLSAKPGTGEKMSLVLTFMPNPNGAIPSKQKQQIMARRIVQKFTGVNSLEDEFRDFNVTSGSGTYAVLHDPNFPDQVAPEGEYATIAAGQIVDRQTIVIVAIYADGVTSKGFADALAVAESFVVSSD